MDYTPSFGIINKHELTFIIESPHLNALNIDSGGSFICENEVVTDKFSLIHNSSATVDLKVKTNELITLHDGSGELKISGSATTHKLTNDSSGKLKAFRLLSENCQLLQDGSGDVEIQVSKLLKGTLDSSGDVYVKGNPEIQITDEGSGKIIKL